MNRNSVNMKSENLNYELHDGLALTLAQQQFITPEIMQYARKLAHDMKCSCLDHQDLEQEALLGLCLAARSYDPCSTASFKTYSTYYMRKMMNKYLNRQRHHGISFMNREEDLEIISLDVLAQREWNDDEDDEVHPFFLSADEELLSRQETLKWLLDQLTPLQKEVLLALVGFSGVKISPKEVASQKGICLSRVYKIYNQAMNKLKKLSQTL